MASTNSTDFVRLSQSLHDLGLDPSARLVPAVLRYCTKATELAAVLSALQPESAGARLRIAICYDGVSKLCSGGGTSATMPSPMRTVDDLVAAALGEAFPGALLHHIVLDVSHGYPVPRELATHDAVARLVSALAFPDISGEEGLPDVFLACGSGSLVDVVKHAVWTLEQRGWQRPALWVVPTALTVTAFTSRYAVLGHDGHKSTVPSALADAVVFCEPIVTGAPADLRAAGVGDLIAGHVSYADWYVASRLGLADDYRPEPAALMMPLHRFLLTDQMGDGSASTQTLTQTHTHLLAETLAAAGVAMNLGGSSAPQSGGEHAVSHVIDELRHISGRPRHLHGLQVALAALATASMHDWLDNVDFIPAGRVVAMNEDEMAAAVDRLFWLAPFSGSPAEFADPGGRLGWIDAHRAELEASCARFVESAVAKAAVWRDLKGRISHLQKEWPEIQRVRHTLCATSLNLAASMERWHLPLSTEELDPPAHVTELRWALRASVFFRARFGIQDLVFFLGEDPVFAAAL